jgi:hypothetical protein
MNGCGFSSPNNENKSGNEMLFWKKINLVDGNQEQLVSHLLEHQYYHVALVSHRFQLNVLLNEHYLL